jgi:hypothetical protein
MLATVDDVRDVEVRAHGLTAVAEVRPRAGGAWLPMMVVNGSVTVAAMGELPGRTVSVTVMNSPINDAPLLTLLDIFGSWVRVAHRVQRSDLSTFDVSLGYFRVNSLAVDPLAGTVTIQGGDAGALVADYGLPTLAAGEQAAGTPHRDFIAALLNATLTNIPPWWTNTVDISAAPTTLPVARVQYEGSRAQAVKDVSNSIAMRIRTCIDGITVFRLVPTPAFTDPPVATITPGELGNLTTLQSTMERAGVANVATIKYTEETGVDTTQESSLSMEYISTTSPISADGPFGRVTVDAQSQNVKTPAEATAAMEAVLAESARTARDFRIGCSPIYGIEAGDTVTVVGRTALATPAVVTGATIPLTASAAWTLDLRAFVPSFDIEAKRSFR